LVVIAIIGVLIALLLPAVQAAREAARRTQCANNLKQIGLAVLEFESANKRLPAGSTTRTANIGGPYYSTWTVDILPYIEQPALYELWDSSVGFTAAANKALRETFVTSYLCPSDQDTDTLFSPESNDSGRNLAWAPGSYRAMAGASLGMNGDHYWDNPNYLGHPNEMPAWQRGAMFSVATNPGGSRSFQAVEVAEILDGTSNTFLVGEYHTQTYRSRRTFWAYAYTSYNQSGAFPESRILLPDYERCVAIGGGGVHTCKRAWGSLHTGNIVQFTYCDGSVRTVDQDIDMDLFVKLATIQDEGAVMKATTGRPPRGR
jgi:type II secretory pathway pseudopilin PulG